MFGFDSQVGWGAGSFSPRTNRRVFPAAAQGIKEKSRHSGAALRAVAGARGGLVVGQCLGFPVLGKDMAQGAVQAKHSPAAAGEWSDSMASLGGRVMGPRILSQLRLFELNVIENERRQRTRR